MNIEGIMTRPVVTCNRNDTLDTAAKLMWEHDCGAVAVTDESGQLVGMITDRDICMATYTKARPPHAITTAEAMANQVFSAHKDDSIDAVETLMSEKQIRRIPVVNGDNRPIGMLSLNDLARHAATMNKRSGFEHTLTRTLSAICMPRTVARASSHALASVQPQTAL
jgi:CBS domain-containing protein